jgi:hypothetical protein
MFGRQLTNGVIERIEAEWLMERSSEINLSVWDEVDPFVK